MSSTEIAAAPPGAARAAVRVIERVTEALWVVGGAAAVVMAINVTVAVLSRYLFRNPMSFTLDLTQYWWMPIIAAAPMAAALLRNEHITAPILVDLASERARRITAVGTLVLTFATVSLLVWNLLEKAITSVELQEAAVGTPWVALWPIRIIMVAAFVAFALQTAAEVIKIIVPAAALAAGAEGDPE